MANDKAIDYLHDLLLNIVDALVDDPEAIEVHRTVRGEDLTLHVDVAVTDAGKLIGRMGRTARAIRTIMTNAGARFKIRCNVDIQGAEHGRD